MGWLAGWGPRAQTHFHTACGRSKNAAHPGGAGQLQEAGLLEGLQLSLQLLQRVPGLQKPLLQVHLLLLGEGPQVGRAFSRPWSLSLSPAWVPSPTPRSPPPLTSWACSFCSFNSSISFWTWCCRIFSRLRELLGGGATSAASSGQQPGRGRGDSLHRRWGPEGTECNRARLGQALKRSRSEVRSSWVQHPGTCAGLESGWVFSRLG